MGKIDAFTALVARPREHDGERVVTFADVDLLHQRPDGSAGRTFRENRSRFTEGLDYHYVSPEDFPATSRVAGKVIVLTERGYTKLTKPMRDDVSWAVYDKVVDGYFRAREAAQKLPDDAVVVSRAELEAAREAAEEHARTSARLAKVLAKMASNHASGLATYGKLLKQVDVRRLASEDPDQALIPGVQFTDLVSPSEVGEAALVARVLQFLRGQRTG